MWVEVRSNDHLVTRQGEPYARPGEMVTLTLTPRHYDDVLHAQRIDRRSVQALTGEENHGNHDKIICITCPKGCTLEVTHDGQTVVKVNQGCKRGKEYAQRELVDPRRMVATTVRVKGGRHPLLPVATAAPFPKPLIFDLMAELRKVNLAAPRSGWARLCLPMRLGPGSM